MVIGEVGSHCPHGSKIRSIVVSVDDYVTGTSLSLIVIVSETVNAVSNYHESVSILRVLV